jgi:hypothetical protein
VSGFLVKWSARNSVAASPDQGKAEALRRAVPIAAATTPAQGPRHRAKFAHGVDVEIEPDDQGRWHMIVTRGWARERVKNFCTPFAAHAARTAEAWFGEPVTMWEPEIEE